MYRINERILYRDYEQGQDQILLDLAGLACGRSGSCGKSGTCIFPVFTGWWIWPGLTAFPETCGTVI